jgi:hypothetical protein
MGPSVPPAAAAAAAGVAPVAQAGPGPWAELVVRAADLWPAHWVGVVAVTLGTAMLATAVAGGADLRAGRLTRHRSRELAQRARLQRWQEKVEAEQREQAEQQRRAEIVAAARELELQRLDELRQQTEREEQARLAALEANADKILAAERAERAIIEGRAQRKSILQRD